MHIEPGLVTGAKIVLSYGTAAAAAGLTLKSAFDALREKGALSLAGRSAIATAATLFFFQVAQHHAVGISEVHLIMGSTLFLLFGMAPAAIGLAMGLLIQGLVFAQIALSKSGLVTPRLFAAA